MVADARDVSWDVDTDVVVVGSGGCGLIAANTAASTGDLRVTVLEKGESVGGTTALSGGSIVGAGTRIQDAAGIQDSPAALTSDILEYTNHEPDERIVTVVAEESPRTIAWLLDELGVDLVVNPEDAYRRHGHRVNRRHWLLDDAGTVQRNGEALIEHLHDEARRRSVEIVTNSPVTDLVMNDEGSVVGVVAGRDRDESIRAGTVLLATGGFGANPRLREEYCPEAAGLLYWGAEGNTGDGITWGRELGGGLAGMTAYLGFPTISEPHHVFVPWEIVKQGGIVVGSDGRRFADAGSFAYSAFASVLAERSEPVAYLVFDEYVHDLMRAEPSAKDRYEECLHYDVFAQAASFADIGSQLGIDGDRLGETVRLVNAIVHDGAGGDGYGRAVSRELTPPAFGTTITPSILQTQGGLRVDETANVVTDDGVAIPNLYAGGGAAAGLSGNSPRGYLSGNGLLAALNLGRIMGRAARESLRAD